MKKEKWGYLALILLILGFIFILIPSIFALPFPSDLDQSNFSDKFFKLDLKTSNEGTGFITLDPNAIDQMQNKFNGIWTIGPLPDIACYCQRVINNRQPLTGFMVSIGKHGNPAEPVYIGVMSGKKSPFLNESWHYLGALLPNQFPNPDILYWVSCDLTGHELNQKECYIVCLSAQNPATGSYYTWGIGIDNPYPRGEPWAWNWLYLWQNYSSTNRDLEFVTYTIPVGGSAAPTIQVGFSSWNIISYISGTVSFFGAAVAGMKSLRFL